MKKNYLFRCISALLIIVSLFNTIDTFAKDPDFYPGLSVNDWNLVDYAPSFFDKDEFAQNFSIMPEGSWIKSNGSSYGDSYCGAAHITKFTTSDGTEDFEPQDAVMYKFAVNKKNKQITFSILDKDDDKDNSLSVAALENGVWKFIQNVSTSGEENCSSYTVKLPDDAEAVLLYMPVSSPNIYMGRVDITEDDNNNTLPVTMYDVSVQSLTKTISWKVGSEQGVDKYVIQGSNDAKNWIDVTSVNAEGKEEYSALLTSLTAKAGFCFWLALLLIPFAFKQKRKAIFGALSLLLFAGTFISCSKDKDVASSGKNNLYKYYRVESMRGNTPVEISEIISLK